MWLKKCMKNVLMSSSVHGLLPISIFKRKPPKVGLRFTISSADFPVFQPVSGAAPVFEMKIMGILIEEFKHCL